MKQQDHIPALTALYGRYQNFDLLVDSRRVTDPAGSLFFSLPGERTDGHDYLAVLIGAGVRHFVVRPEKMVGKDLGRLLSGQKAALIDWRDYKKVPDEKIVFLTAERPLELLQALAAYHRRRFNIPVLAITGSNGKTIVKDWLAQLLGRRFAVCASPRSFNSQIGVPLSVWRLRREHQLAVFEAGVSRSGEMARLAEIIRPTCGLFTMLGSAHDAGFPDRESKHREKLDLFAGAKWVAVVADDNDSIRLLRKSGIDPLTFLGVEGRFLEVNEESLRLDFPKLPTIYLENAYAAVAVAYELGLDRQVIAEELPRLQPLTNRLEQREGLHGGIVVNDSYSNDLSALTAALDFAVAQNPFPGLTLILGTLQPGSSNRQRTGGPARKEALVSLLADRITRLITVGETNTGLPADHHFATPEALLAALDELPFRNETILVKGASYERFDRIADKLSRSRHETLLRLNLSALRHNFLVYRRSVKAAMIVMVKASAYGSGALPVARALTTVGADRLAVAYPEEGRALREGGVVLPIMVLNCKPADYARCAEDRLEPVVHRLADLHRAARLGLRVHLEINTGMARLGFQPREAATLARELSGGDLDNSIASVFTHLAAAEEPGHDDFTLGQLSAFEKVYRKIAEALPVAPARHVLNSNGITRFPDHAYEFVRLGIGLYGIGDSGRREELRPALSLLTHVTSVYAYPAGASIGYGRHGRLTRDSLIAVLPLGYADGLPRLAGEGRFHVRVGRHLAPTIGTVCMDMTTIDVTELPEVRAGTEVIIFGPGHDIDHLASAARTIPYEILTGIGSRVHRVYSEE